MFAPRAPVVAPGLVDPLLRDLTGALPGPLQVGRVLLEPLAPALQVVEILLMALLEP